MDEYIFTFGFGQQHQNGFHAIQAEDPNKARSEMFSKFGRDWALQYDPPNAREKAGVDRFNLHEVK